MCLFQHVYPYAFVSLYSRFCVFVFRVCVYSFLCPSVCLCVTVSVCLSVRPCVCLSACRSARVCARNTTLRAVPSRAVRRCDLRRRRGRPVFLRGLLIEQFAHSPCSPLRVAPSFHAELACPLEDRGRP